MADQVEIRELTRSIGARMKLRRRALGLTQERLAEQVGLSPTYVAKLEAGDKAPSFGTIMDLANALELEIRYLGI